SGVSMNEVFVLSSVGRRRRSWSLLVLLAGAVGFPSLAPAGAGGGVDGPLIQLPFLTEGRTSLARPQPATIAAPLFGGTRTPARVLGDGPRFAPTAMHF